MNRPPNRPGDNAANDALVTDLLNLYQGLLVPFMKVRRDIPFPTEPERHETDGEHAFTLSMIALTIAERMQLKLDRGKIAEYALVHDLVEAHAGDVSARASDDALLLKVDREKEAYVVIKQQYADIAPWIPRLIERYEDRTDEEGRFVYAVDKLMGGLTWLAGEGHGWEENYPESDGSRFHLVYARLRAKASLYPPLLELYDAVHEELDKQWPGYLKHAKAPKP